MKISEVRNNKDQILLDVHQKALQAKSYNQNGTRRKFSGYIFFCQWFDKVSIFCKNRYHLIPIKIRTPLNFAPLILSHPQIWRTLRFRAPLIFAHLYFTVNLLFFSFICGIFSPLFNFRAFVLHQLAFFNFNLNNVLFVLVYLFFIL